MRKNTQTRKKGWEAFRRKLKVEHDGETWEERRIFEILPNDKKRFNRIPQWILTCLHLWYFNNKKHENLKNCFKLKFNHDEIFHINLNRSSTTSSVSLKRCRHSVRTPFSHSLPPLTAIHTRKWGAGKKCHKNYSTTRQTSASWGISLLLRLTSLKLL